MGKLIKISGLWARQDKNENLVLSGNISKEARYIILKNTFKRNEKDPDYYLYVAEIEKKPEEMGDVHEKKHSLIQDDLPF